MRCWKASRPPKSARRARRTGAPPAEATRARQRNLRARSDPQPASPNLFSLGPRAPHGCALWPMRQTRRFLRTSVTLEIDAKVVKELREKTGAGVMDCKKALAETGGDPEK